jgi:hypothetical protein
MRASAAARAFEAALAQEPQQADALAVGAADTARTLTRPALAIEPDHVVARLAATQLDAVEGGSDDALAASPTWIRQKVTKSNTAKPF